MEKENSVRPLGISEAAEYLGLSKAFLYKLTSQGRITHYKPNGGRLYFKVEDLDRYVYNGRRSAEFELNQEAERFLSKPTITSSVNRRRP